MLTFDSGSLQDSLVKMGLGIQVRENERNTYQNVTTGSTKEKRRQWQYDPEMWISGFAVTEYLSNGVLV
jgi:hypothetical protein